MSYILDALKKSEAQRRQQEGLAADAVLNQQSNAKISNRGTPRARYGGHL